MKTRAREAVSGGIGSSLSIGLVGQRLPVKVTADCLHYPENKRMCG